MNYDIANEVAKQAVLDGVTSHDKDVNIEDLIDKEQWKPEI